MPDGVVLQIPVEPFLNPRGKFIPAADTQRERKLRAVSERQQPSPFGCRDAAKITSAILAEAETPQNGKQRGRHSTPPANQ